MTYDNLVIDQGVCKDGIRNRLHFQDGTLFVERTYDAEPHLDYARRMRQATEGKNWGEGKKIGHIPPAVLGKALTIRDNAERQKFIMDWLRENKAFQMFERAFIVPTTYRTKTTPSVQEAA